MSLLEREMNLVAADPLIDMLIVRPHLDMIGAAGSNQIEQLITYLSDFCRGNQYGKPTVIVFHSFSNEPWERELRVKYQLELPQKGVAVYSSLTGASRAMARFYEYHRFQKELEADRQQQ